MPDISMCGNVKCPLRMKCYRYTAIPSTPWQTFSDYKNNGNACPDFWDNTGRRNNPNVK